MARDTDATSFTAILDALVERVPGAYAAALVDSLGETVDYAGRGEPFDLRVAAAHFQILLANIERFGALGEPRWVVVRSTKKSIAASVLPDGYVLVILLRARAAFTISTRALKVCTRALANEAGWNDLEKRDGVKQRSWFEVTVETDRRGRPSHVQGAAKRVAVEILGTVMGLSVRERGFRVRTDEGSELTLVREPKQRWYADEPV
jgi:predicted regulator of Ras-like GTPase activity (Roadblock/LC7/MglB family)